MSILRLPQRFAARAGGGNTRYQISPGVSRSPQPFSSEDIWTVITLARNDGGTADEQAIISSWSSGGRRHFILRITSDAPPKNIEVYVDNTLSIATSTEPIEANEWYCISVSNDGSQAADGLKLTFHNLGSNTFGELTGDHPTTDTGGVSLDEVYVLSRGPSAASDEIGAQAHVAYFNSRLTNEEIRQYAYDPISIVNKHWNHTEFYFPLGQGHSVEHDWGPYRRIATLIGTETSRLPLDVPRLRPYQPIRRRVYSALVAASPPDVASYAGQITTPSPPSMIPGIGY